MHILDIIQTYDTNHKTLPVFTTWSTYINEFTRYVSTHLLPKQNGKSKSNNTYETTMLLHKLLCTICAEWSQTGLMFHSFLSLPACFTSRIDVWVLMNLMRTLCQSTLPKLFTFWCSLCGCVSEALWRRSRVSRRVSNASPSPRDRAAIYQWSYGLQFPHSPGTKERVFRKLHMKNFPHHIQYYSRFTRKHLSVLEPPAVHKVLAQ
jgi:hypothetical protein